MEMFMIGNKNLIVGFINSLRREQNDHHFADNIYKKHFLKENLFILIETSLNFVSWGFNWQ